MPVARGPQVSARSAIVVGLTGVVLAAVIVTGALWLAGSGGNVEIQLGDRDFRELDAQRISQEIADRGPVLFPDLAGGQRDVILQHLGDDVDTGWEAFAARRPDDARDCFFQWRVETGDFVNTCDPGDVVDASGGDLRHYPVEVVDGDVRVDINAEDPGTGE